MPYTKTCGAPGQAKDFAYCGSVEKGVTLIFKKSKDVNISTSFLTAIRNEFQGCRIVGGFSMTDPPPDGFGAWIQLHSTEFNSGQALTPRHGSFIAAILRDAGWLQCQLEGRRVILNFENI